MFYERYVYLNIGGDLRTIIPNNPPYVYDINFHRTLHTPLLKENNLESWTIIIEKVGVNFLGTCYYKKKTIYINPTALYLLDFQQMRNLLLHEIAHALTPNCGHNEVWRAKCIELGGTGNACHDIIDFNCVDFKNQIYKITLDK